MSNIWELAYREGQMLWICIHFQLTGGPCEIAKRLIGDLRANADRAASLQCAWKNGSLPKIAQGGSPGKTVMDGCVCYFGANCDLDPWEPGYRIKTGLATRPCDVNKNYGKIGGWKKRQSHMKRHVQHHPAVSATANEGLEHSLTGRCFYSNRRCS